MTTLDLEHIQHLQMSPAPGPAISFGDQVLAFYRKLPHPEVTSSAIEWLDPFHLPEVRRCMDAFYGRFYSDNRQRLFLFGINPGRYGSGITGIPFTDSHTLAHACDIVTSLPQRRELSATFIHRVIQAWGGADSFFGQMYITAVSPLGLLRGGKNFNYYDDRSVLRELEPFLVDSIRRQISFGAQPRAAVVIGTGTNLKVMQRLNAEHHFFDELHAVEHPRFIMQYRRNQVDEFVAGYLRVFKELLG
jgi:uracil DNA glycosylase superfamily protein